MKKLICALLIVPVAAVLIVGLSEVLFYWPYDSWASLSTLWPCVVVIVAVGWAFSVWLYCTQWWWEETLD